MFPFSTYDYYLIIVVIGVLLSFYSKIKKIYALPLLILNILTLIKLIYFLNSKMHFADLSEIKIILFANLFVLSEGYFLKKSHELIIKISFVVFGLISFIVVFLYFGRFTRFMDYVPYFSHYISIYFAVTASLLWAVYQKSIILPALIILSASGTGLLAATPVVFSKILRSKFLYQRVLIVTLFILGAAFISYMQFLRGRSVTDLSSIDRIQFYVGFYHYVMNDMNWIQHLMGHNIGEHIAVDSYVTERFAEYLLAERDGYIPPRMFHSDIIRIYLQYGAIGIILIALLLVRIFQRDRLILLVLMASGLANSVLYITPIFVITFYLLKRKRARI